MERNELLRQIFLDGINKIKEWYRKEDAPYLRSIFDQTGFKDREEGVASYFVPPASLCSEIPYPVREGEANLRDTKKKVLSEIEGPFRGFPHEYLDSLSVNQLYFLLEKFGGNIPFDSSCKISVFDAYKIKAAKEVIEHNRKNLSHRDNLLILVDFSGIQEFIYNITSEGALKNLRSRSFYMELLSHHIIKRILEAFHLHHANVLMSGGGSAYILSGCPDDFEHQLYDTIADSFNAWLFREFRGMICAVFSAVKCTDESLGRDLSGLLRELSKKSFVEKRKKFHRMIEKEGFLFLEVKEPHRHECSVCRRDDAGAEYKPLSEAEGKYLCHLCSSLVKLGNHIPKTSFVYSVTEPGDNILQVEDSYYLLSEEKAQGMDKDCAWVVYDERSDLIGDLTTASPIFMKSHLTKNSELPHRVYKNFEKKRNMLKTRLKETLGEEEKKSIKQELAALEPDSVADLDFMSMSSEGAEFIASLRMDADNMGKILQGGFYSETTLEGLSALSRSLNYFFKLHLSWLCREGLGRGSDHVYALENEKARNAHVIYAGGDDLFILGAWSDTAKLAMDIGEAFLQYTCNNLDMGLSGGLTLHQPRFPVSKMAYASMNALNIAKENLQPCWMCRKSWADCPLLDQGDCQRKDSLVLFFTDHLLTRKMNLDEVFRTQKYSPESSRLKLAVKWKYYDTEKKQVVNEIEEYITRPFSYFKAGSKALPGGFFHNLLSLIEVWYTDGVLYLPRVVWLMEKFKTKLKGKIDNESLYELYDMSVHVYDPKRLSTLIIPLSWNILSMRGGEDNYGD